MRSRDGRKWLSVEKQRLSLWRGGIREVRKMGVGIGAVFGDDIRKPASQRSDFNEVIKWFRVGVEGDVRGVRKGGWGVGWVRKQ